MATVSLSPMPESSSNDAKLLFCPFCRECYEGETVCPVHELPLVDFVDLPKQSHERQVGDWEEDLDPWDIRFGRGWIALGAALVAAGFFMPFASATVEDQSVAWSGLDLALGPARSMWTVPFVAVLFVWLLLRRRTILQMLGARLVAFLLAFMPVISCAYAMVHMWRGIERMHGAGLLEWGYGIVVMAIGSALLAIGGLRFGVVPREALPHGAAPDEREPAVGTIDMSEDAER